MLSAKEAAAKSNEIIKQHKTQELSMVDKMISRAISEGERRCDIDGSLSSITKKELKNLGYKVECGTQYNESWVIIRW